MTEAAIASAPAPAPTAEAVTSHVETGPDAAPSPEGAAPNVGPAATTGPGGPKRPSFVFFGAVASLSLLSDVLSKAWAEVQFSERGPTIELVRNHLSLILAYNRGGAWGLLQDANEAIRRPFFLAVSVAAILFIVSLYGRLQAGQQSLKWGLPLVLGGALGNLTDRIVRTSVVDFIDYRAEWITKMNETIARMSPAWNVTDHWPTFNVADVSICVGVLLMAVDMITSKQATPARAA